MVDLIKSFTNHGYDVDTYDNAGYDDIPSGENLFINDSVAKTTSLIFDETIDISDIIESFIVTKVLAATLNIVDSISNNVNTFYNDILTILDSKALTPTIVLDENISLFDALQKIISIVFDETLDITVALSNHITKLFRNYAYDYAVYDEAQYDLGNNGEIITMFDAAALIYAVFFDEVINILDSVSKFDTSISKQDIITILDSKAFISKLLKFTSLSVTDNTALTPKKVLTESFSLSELVQVYRFLFTFNGNETLSINDNLVKAFLQLAINIESRDFRQYFVAQLEEMEARIYESYGTLEGF